MKKFQKIFSALIILLLVLTVFAACAETQDTFSAQKVKSVYEEAGFNVQEWNKGGVYENIDFSEISDIDKIFVVTKNNDSALIVVFSIPRASSDVSDKLRGDGFLFGKGNVEISRYKINGLTDGYNLQSPEIVAINKPLSDAEYDSKITI